MLSGTIYITSDIQMAMTLGNDPAYSVVGLVDHRDALQGINGIVCGDLLPSYEAISAELDGNLPASAAIYFNNLNEKMSTLSLIIFSMYKGKNIILFLPEDESMNLNFANVFIQFFLQAFGIVIGTPNVPFGYNSNYDYILLTYFYLYGYLSMDEFIVLSPAGYPVLQGAVDKFCMDLNVKFSNPQEAIVYIDKYIANCKEAKSPLKIVLKKGMKR